MSDVEVCNSESEAKQAVPEPPDGLFEKLEDFPEALEYIKILQKQIKKHLRRLRRFKSKFKQQRKKIDVGTQTDGDLSNGTANTAKSIAEEIKEAAEEATQNTGFVYDESSGLYYDSTTGFYYNAEYGLYYDASSCTYMTYKQETNTYEFHSQVVPTQDTHHQAKEHYKKRKAKQNKDEAKAAKSARLMASEDTEYETEEGECSRSDSEQSESEINSDTSDVSKQWPPCMRIIVEQSKSPKIKIGSLHILTFEGGTLGREGEHAILLPDINISKCHLKFSFDKEANQFSVVDLGSRNGTVLNGKRMAASKQESEAFEVAHGSRIQIGSIVLLCHVHEGSKTCGLCEPGLVQACEVQAVETVIKVSKSAKHKAELKNLRKKFGVSAYEDDNTKLASGYTDRAQHRRETVGSQNPHEKTEVASVNESIPSQNKGFKMLAKMGWKEGQSLGKEGQGIVEPVRLVSNPGTSGVGNSEAPIPDVDSDKSKHMIWRKTQERYKKLPNSTVFEDSD